MDALDVSRARRLQTLKHSSRDPAAQSHLEFAAFLEVNKGTSSFPFSEVFVDQWVMLSLVNALELETLARFHFGFESLWTERKKAIPCLFEEENLHPEIVFALKGLEQRHSLWLSSREFPERQSTRLLRRILQLQERDDLKAGLLETGILLFFFGQNQMLGDFPLRNVLQVIHPAPLALTEMCLRLTRADRLRKKILSSASEIPNNAHLSQLESDCLRVFELISTISFAK